MEKLILDGVEISNDSSCYIIAEIGHNHQGDLENCKKLFLESSRQKSTVRSKKK